MSDTTVTCTVSPCTVVIQLDSPLLSMDEASAAQIAVAIAAAWATGYAIRMVIRALNNGPSTNEESE